MRADRTVSIVNAHAEGEVGNVIVGGVIDVPGNSVFEKMEYLRDTDDGLRRSLLFEPRGSPSQAVNVLLPASNPEADLGYVIMEATKYPVMSGSNTICVATVILETGILPMTEPETVLKLEAPGGLVEARCECRDGKVERVHLTMLPSFVLARDLELEVEGFGRLGLDISYGGIFFAIIPATELGLELRPENAAELVRAGVAIRDAVNAVFGAVHPEDPRIRGVANVLITGDIEDDGPSLLQTVSATVIGNGRLDRSPTGTGLSARLALLHEEKTIRTGQQLISRSLFGTSFHGSVLEEGSVGGLSSVTAEISGTAWITGVHQAIIDKNDPLAGGHTPADMWLSAG